MFWNSKSNAEMVWKDTADRHTVQYAARKEDKEVNNG